MGEHKAAILFPFFFSYSSCSLSPINTRQFFLSKSSGTDTPKLPIALNCNTVKENTPVSITSTAKPVSNPLPQHIGKTPHYPLSNQIGSQTLTINLPCSSSPREENVKPPLPLHSHHQSTTHPYTQTMPPMQRVWYYWRCSACGDCNREDRRRCRNRHCDHRRCRACNWINDFYTWRCHHCSRLVSETRDRCPCGHRQCSRCVLVR